MGQMGVISEFLGMRIEMAYQAEAEPHCRVIYWDWDGPELRAKYGLRSRRVIQGQLLELGVEALGGWVSLHIPELEQAWRDSRDGKPLLSIAPL